MAENHKFTQSLCLPVERKNLDKFLLSRLTAMADEIPGKVSIPGFVLVVFDSTESKPVVTAVSRTVWGE